MVPWPVALLSIFYGVIAAASLATAWKILSGVTHQPLLWAFLWLGLSIGLACGLPLLKAWARRLAIFGSAVTIVLTLSVATLLITHARPVGALLATLGAGMHVVVIRYLQRPDVKAYFA